MDESDDKLIKMMYAIAEEYNGCDDEYEEFAAEDIKEFEEATRSRLNGESKTYTREEAKSNIAGKTEMD